MLTRRIDFDAAFLKQFTRYGNYEQVRITAWSSLLRISPDSREVWLSMLEFVATDTTNIRRKVLAEALLWVRHFAQ